jgi:hypothetical protein
MILSIDFHPSYMNVSVLGSIKQILYRVVTVQKYAESIQKRWIGLMLLKKLVANGGVFGI